MRALLQRTASARVEVEGNVVGEIGRGLLVLLGVAQGDTPENADDLARKTLELRVFPDDNDKMNRSVVDIGGEILVVSQFTLQAECRRGRRPDFTGAAAPALADALYCHYIDRLRTTGISVQTGVFGAHMQVSLLNDGPVTILLERP